PTVLRRAAPTDHAPAHPGAGDVRRAVAPGHRRLRARRGERLDGRGHDVELPVDGHGRLRLPHRAHRLLRGVPHVVGPRHPIPGGPRRPRRRSEPGRDVRHPATDERHLLQPDAAARPQRAAPARPRAHTRSIAEGGAVATLEAMAVVKINAIEVPEGAGPELEKRFANRLHAVDGQPGFISFELLRPVSGESRYFVVTHWEDDESFQAWMKGAGLQAHSGERARPVGTGSSLLEF